MGFKAGDYVQVVCEDGRLIITRDEAKAQEKEEERAFVEKEMRKLVEIYRKGRRGLKGQQRLRGQQAGLVAENAGNGYGGEEKEGYGKG